MCQSIRQGSLHTTKPQNRQAPQHLRDRKQRTQPRRVKQRCRMLLPIGRSRSPRWRPNQPCGWPKKGCFNRWIICLVCGFMCLSSLAVIISGYFFVRFFTAVIRYSTCREVGVGGTWFKVGAQVEAVKDRSWCYVLALHAQAGLRIFVQRFEF